jgi:hypothetical protein
MPPYKPVVSKAQSRKLFALAAEGKISEAEAEGKTRAANWEKLPTKTNGTDLRARLAQQVARRVAR